MIASTEHLIRAPHGGAVSRLGYRLIGWELGLRGFQAQTLEIFETFKYQ